MSVVWTEPLTTTTPQSKKRKETPPEYKHTPEEWEARRDRITELFENHELPEVAAKLEQEGFIASIPQYRARLKNWGHWKYLKLTEHQWRWIGQKLVERADEGKDRTAFKLNGKKIPSSKLEREYAQKAQEDNFDVASMISAISSCHLSAYTSSTVNGVRTYPPRSHNPVNGRPAPSVASTLRQSSVVGSEVGAAQSQGTSILKRLLLESKERCSKLEVWLWDTERLLQNAEENCRDMELRLRNAELGLVSAEANIIRLETRLRETDRLLMESESNRRETGFLLRASESNRRETEEELDSMKDNLTTAKAKLSILEERAQKSERFVLLTEIDQQKTKAALRDTQEQLGRTREDLVCTQERLAYAEASVTSLLQANSQVLDKCRLAYNQDAAMFKDTNLDRSWFLMDTILKGLVPADWTPPTEPEDQNEASKSSSAQHQGSTETQAHRTETHSPKDAQTPHHGFKVYLSPFLSRDQFTVTGVYHLSQCFWRCARECYPDRGDQFEIYERAEFRWVVVCLDCGTEDEMDVHEKVQEIKRSIPEGAGWGAMLNAYIESLFDTYRTAHIGLARHDENVVKRMLEPTDTPDSGIGSSREGRDTPDSSAAQDFPVRNNYRSPYVEDEGSNAAIEEPEADSCADNRDSQSDGAVSGNGSWDFIQTEDAQQGVHETADESNTLMNTDNTGKEESCNKSQSAGTEDDIDMLSIGDILEDRLWESNRDSGYLSGDCKELKKLQSP